MTRVARNNLFRFYLKYPISRPFSLLPHQHTLIRARLEDRPFDTRNWTHLDDCSGVIIADAFLCLSGKLFI